MKKKSEGRLESTRQKKNTKSQGGHYAKHIPCKKKLKPRQHRMTASKPSTILCRPSRHTNRHFCGRASWRNHQRCYQKTIQGSCKNHPASSESNLAHWRSKLHHWSQWQLRLCSDG